MSRFVYEHRLLDLTSDLAEAIETIRRGNRAGRAYRDYAIATIEQTIDYLSELRLSSGGDIS